MQMNLDWSRDTWYSRWFFWSADVYAEFRNHPYQKRDADYYRLRGANGCVFSRTTFLAAPLTIALHAIAYGTLLASLTYVPYKLWGTSYIQVCFGVAVFVASAWLLKQLWPTTIAPRLETAFETAGIYVHNRRLARVQKSPGFFAFVWQQMVSAKQAICPIIRFH